jgi:hypothetical protein
VQQFFVREPCRFLRRTLIPLAGGDGNTIIVAIAWVRMYTTAGATRLGDLIDADGTGGIQPIADPLLEYNGIVFTGQHYAVRRTSVCPGDSAHQRLTTPNVDDVLAGQTWPCFPGVQRRSPIER